MRLRKVQVSDWAVPDPRRTSKLRDNKQNPLTSHVSKYTWRYTGSTSCGWFERVLGVLWKVVEDVFQFEVFKPNKPATKRGILSKKIMQRLCKLQLGWGDPVPECELDRSERWKSELWRKYRYRDSISSYAEKWKKSLFTSLRSRRESVPARRSRTRVQKAAQVGRRMGRSLVEFAARENSLAGESCEGISGFAAKSFARAPTPASYAGYSSPVLRRVRWGLCHVLLSEVRLWGWLNSVLLPDWQVKGDAGENDFNPKIWASSSNAFFQHLPILSRGDNIQE